MQPENLRFGGGAAQTMINPLMAAGMILAAVLICLLPRKYIIVPLLAGTFLIPMDQVIVLGALHFYVLRVLIPFGWARMLFAKISSNERILSGGFNAIDIAMFLFTIISAADFILLWQESGAVIKQLGTVYTILGAYILLRFLIRNEEDLLRSIRVFAYIAPVIAATMVWEQATGVNLYSYINGRPGLADLMERGNRFRAVGPFAQPIPAGTCGAILIPLFVALWLKDRKYRSVALVGIVGATMMVITSVSSTPVLAYAAGVGALCMWPMRKLTRVFRWGIVVALVGLDIVMKAPIWALIARADVIGGSSGYHRYMLVDNFIRHFGTWWLLGTKINGQWGFDMWDLANQYIAVGEVYGLVPLICFVALIVFGFRYLGKARKGAENKRDQLFLWAIGSALFANAVAFFGISYFDQSQVAWYALLAMIAAATGPYLMRPNAEVLRPAMIAVPSPETAFSVLPRPDMAGGSKKPRLQGSSGSVTSRRLSFLK